jgi:hypothetical protein
MGRSPNRSRRIDRPARSYIPEKSSVAPPGRPRPRLCAVASRAASSIPTPRPFQPPKSSQPLRPGAPLKFLNSKSRPHPRAASPPTHLPFRGRANSKGAKPSPRRARPPSIRTCALRAWGASDATWPRLPAASAPQCRERYPLDHWHPGYGIRVPHRPIRANLRTSLPFTLKPAV